MIGEVRHFVNGEVQSSDAATWRLELPNRGALHSIILKAKCTNGGTSGRAVNMLDVIDEVKVIADGSTVLFALYPTEHEKWYETFNGKALPMVETQIAGGVQEITLPILFGDKLLDLVHYLRLAKFQDVELQVEFSPTIAADSGFVTGTVTFDVLLVVTPEDAQLNYEGTFITRRIRSYTPTASGIEEIELPGNTTIRAIGNYVYEAGVADGSNVTKVELEDKSSGKSLFVSDWPEFIVHNQLLFGGDIKHDAVLLLADTETWASRIGEILGYSLQIEETADITNDEFDGAFIDGISGDTVTFDAWDLDVTAGAEAITAAAGDVKLFVSVWGKSPSYFGIIPFNQIDNPAGWLDTSKYGKLVVAQTNGNAGGASYVSIQEVRRF